MTRTEQLIARYLDPDAETYTDDSELITELRRLASLNAAYKKELEWGYRNLCPVTGDPEGDQEWKAAIAATDAARKDAAQ